MIPYEAQRRSERAARVFEQVRSTAGFGNTGYSTEEVRLSVRESPRSLWIKTLTNTIFSEALDGWTGMTTFRLLSEVTLGATNTSDNALS